jgi:hypothetical protein
MRSTGSPRRTDARHGIDPMRYLALLLLAPWLLILGGVYWYLPRRLPRTPARRLFDAVVLSVAMLVTGAAALHGFDAVRAPATGAFGRSSGAIWQQVLPALYGYGAWVGVLLLGALLRHALWRRRASTQVR